MGALLHQLQHGADVFVVEALQVFRVEAAEFGDQVGLAAAAQILLVEPLGLFKVEAGAGFHYALQREGLHQFRQGEEFLLGARVPAEHGQQVDEGFRIVAVLAVAAGDFAVGRHPLQREDGESHLVAVPLAQLALSVGLEQQREVGEVRARVLPSEGFVEQVVQGEGGEPLLAADHVGHLHQVVVHDVGQVVGGKFVGLLPEHLIIQRAGVDGDMAADQVVHLHQPVRIDLEADGPVVGLHQAAHHLFGGERQGVLKREARLVVVGEGAFLGFGGGTQGGELFGAVEGIVREALGNQLFGIFPVDVAAL